MGTGSSFTCLDYNGGMKHKKILALLRGAIKIVLLGMLILHLDEDDMLTSYTMV